MAGEDDRLTDPPRAPRIPRRISLYTYQWIGMAVLAALPVLALFGVFGERWRSTHVASGAIEASVTWPTAFRYLMVNAIDVQVRNRSGTAIDTLTIALDTAYANRFSAVTAIPTFSAAYEVGLSAIAPGETRHVRIEIRGEEYWSHSGSLTIATRSDTLIVPLTTMIFP